MLTELPTSGNLTKEDVKINRLKNKAIRSLNAISEISDNQEKAHEAFVAY